MGYAQRWTEKLTHVDCGSYPPAWRYDKPFDLVQASDPIAPSSQ
jgi:hypothetical protein